VVLSSYQVVEIATSYATSYGGRLLAEAGIPVLRIELDEQPSLQTMPPFGPGGFSVAYLSANAKKACIRIDPSTKAGKELLDRLVARSSVFLTDHAQLWDHKSAGVTCHVHPYPERSDVMYELPSYDALVQSQSGAISMTGRITGPPVKIGFLIGDLAPALYASMGIINGLVDGRQQTVSIYPLDATVSLLSYLGCSFIAVGEEPGFIGSGHPHIVPYGAFTAKDGYVIVAAFTQAFWRKLCAMFNRPDMTDNPRFRTFVDRRDNRDELNGLLNQLFTEDTVKNWVKRLDIADVPNAPMYSMRQALDQEVVEAREMVMELDGIRLLNTPIIGVGKSGGEARPALLRDWRLALESLGLSKAEIDQAKSAGVVTPYYPVES